MGSNPVEALNFVQGFTLQLLKLLHNRDGHFIFSIQYPRFIYMCFIACVSCLNKMSVTDIILRQIFLCIAFNSFLAGIQDGSRSRFPAYLVACLLLRDLRIDRTSLLILSIRRYLRWIGYQLTRDMIISRSENDQNRVTGTISVAASCVGRKYEFSQISPRPTTAVLLASLRCLRRRLLAATFLAWSCRAAVRCRCASTRSSLSWLVSRAASA